MTTDQSLVCPACGCATQSLFEVGDENQRISKDLFHYRQCGSCEYIFLENVPSDLARYYGDGYYKYPTLDVLTATADKDRAKLPAVTRFVQRGRLLEIGPAFGVFACGAKNAGFDVEAIEMDSDCCRYLRETLDIVVYQSAMPHQVMQDINGEFDAIVAWQVIEHLPDPLAFVEAASAKLRPGGILAISTPNPESFQFGVMKSLWPHVDAPRHVTLIPRRVLEVRARRHGLETVQFDDDDVDARIWNRFGWQVLLMNRVPGRWLKAAAYIVGTGLALLLSPLDRRAGSAFTLVMQKQNST